MAQPVGRHMTDLTTSLVRSHIMKLNDLLDFELIRAQ